MVQRKDLAGKTLLPSFMDSHSHLTALAQTMGLVNLRETTSISEIVTKLEQYRKKRNIPKGEWIVGFGYDHNFLAEKRHPNKIDLKDFTENPILLAHVSGHMGVTNALGLEQMKIEKNTPNPEGGKIGKLSNGEVSGYLEETAFYQYGASILQWGEEKIISCIEEAQQEYAKNGITTIQDGLIKPAEWKMLQIASNRSALYLDVVGYVDYYHPEIVRKHPEYVKKYKNHLKIGGYKLLLDGSPQGKTAWMSAPYEGEKEYKGYPVHTDQEVEEAVHQSVLENNQLLTHCNGDNAAEQLIRAYEKEEKEKVKKTRPVMIHAQTVRKDQLVRMKAINMLPSFFIAHTYYWGDIHQKNLGKRAETISPAKTAEELQLPYTFHQDTPVIDPNMLETIWCSVNRKTKEGNVLGKGECIGVYEALKAVTKNVAYQYFEEDTKGTIEEGKLADFVVLDKNPCKVEKDTIKEIKVVETIKEGKTIYRD